MAHVERSIFIDAPVAAVFAVASEVARLVEWYPNLTEVSDASHPRMEDGVTYAWRYSFMGLPFRGTEEVLEVEAPWLIRTASSSGGIPHTFEHAFAAEGGGTRYTLNVDYTPPAGLLGRLADGLFLRRFNEKEAAGIVTSLKRICEARAAVS